MTTSQNIQRRLLHDVLAIIHSKGLSNDYLQELLNIKKTALYSRLKGMKPLSFDEITLLAQTFDLNLNQYFSNSRSKVEVSFPALQTKITDEKMYIDVLLSRLSILAKWRGVELFYVSSEVPVFNYFRYKELVLFKLYIYGRTVWEVPHLQKEAFSLTKNVGADLEKKFQQINDIYTAIPSLEIWNTRFLDNTLNQIKYYMQGGFFEEREDSIFILNQLAELLRELEVAAETGQKTFRNGQKGGQFSLYHNEITHTNNVVMVNSQQEKLLVATFDNPNFFETTDEKLWHYSLNWLNSLKRRSQLITHQSERNRKVLFNLCQQKIKKTKQFIEGLNT